MKCHAGVEFPSGKPCPKCNAKLGEVCWPGINADLAELPGLRTQHTQMRNAINDVELALNGLEIDSIARLFEGAHDSVMVKVPLGALRQLVRCYPTLNRIINDPAFEKPPMSEGQRE